MTVLSVAPTREVAVDFDVIMLAFRARPTGLCQSVCRVDTLVLRLDTEGVNNKNHQIIKTD